MSKSNFDWLPIDLVTKILLKFPVKSIIRFKSVEEKWCYLFQNPKFISQHLSINKRNKCLLVQYCEGTLDNPIVVMRLFVNQALVSYQDMRQQLPHDFSKMFVLQFCVDNGLLCLCDRTNSRITLCNPTTRKSKILPECNESIPRKSYTYSHTLGFGWDNFSNDFKVIYIRSYMDEGENMPMPDHYAVYTMITDSWRVLKHKDFQLQEQMGVCNNDSNACVNSVYYWQSDFNILAFYLGTEVFQLIQSPFPKSFGKLLPLHDHITLWDTEMMDLSERSNEVWLLNDETQWIKLLKIEHILEIERMYGFWKNGNIFVESVTGQLLLYNLLNHDFKEFGIKARVRRNLLQVYHFEESLVAIRID